MYSGTRGPGTLEMTRLSAGRTRGSELSWVTTRVARAKTAAGMNCVTSCSSDAGSARWRSLAALRISCARSSRSRGSGSSVGIGTNIAETRLP